MNMTELKNLCERAAQVVTGKRVQVRLVPPVVRQFDGEVYKSVSGGYVVNVNPELSDENFLYVLCHEMGHVKMNHTSDIDPDRGSGSLQLTPAGELSRLVKPETVKREQDAERLGQVYLKYAQENYHRFQGDTKLERELKALCSYLPPELQKIAERNGWYAGLKTAELETWKKQQEQLHERK